MKKLWSVLFTSMVCASFTGTALAQDRGTKEEAKSMVDAAVEHAKKVGAEQAFKDFTDKGNKDWHKKDLYVFAYSMDGVSMAHGANEKLIGKNLLDMKDPTGKPLIRDLRDTAAKGGGWVDYEWPHPETKKNESKASYVRKFANYEGFLGVGVYR